MIFFLGDFDILSFIYFYFSLRMGRLNPLPPSDTIWKQKKNRGSFEFSIVTIEKIEFPRKPEI